MRRALLPVAAPTAAEPNPPLWGASVHVFSPRDRPEAIAAAVRAAFAQNGGTVPQNHGEFARARHAFLFKPGRYTVDVPVGFYTSVAGLGETPDATVFAGAKGVHCEQGGPTQATGALSTFWRSAENFRSAATHEWVETDGGAGMLWAASQAAPLRRLHVDRSLLLWQLAWNATSDTPWAALVAGFASGGFVADSSVDGDVWLQSQQQYFLRNTALRGSALRPAAWSTVLVGCTGDGRPARSTCADANATSVVDATPLVAEKPYIAVRRGDDSRFELRVPPLKRESVGPSSDGDGDDVVGFEHVFVARPDLDTAASINAKLGAAHVRAVVLSPGVYRLGAPLRVARTNVTLLGLGFATLVTTNGTAAVEVDGGVSGVRIAGLLLEAGPLHSAALLHVQAGAPPPADAAGSVVLSDVFVRVGGPGGEARAGTMVQIDAAGAVVDNMWLWRADHEADPAYYGGGGGGGAATNASIRDRDGRLTGVRFVDGGGASARTCEHGLVVGESAANVTAYGLAVEHALGDQVVWKGDGGRTYFYQSELPYDVTRDELRARAAAAGADALAGYRVADRVTTHRAVGAGVYHFFRRPNVSVASAIAAPRRPGVEFVAPFAVALGGGGRLEGVLNGAGGASSVELGQGTPVVVCNRS